MGQPRPPRHDSADGTTQVIIDGPLAERLRRIAHHRAEMILVLERIDRAEAALDGDDVAAAGDAFEAALVAYGRPFGSGAERRLNVSELTGLSAAEVVDHEQTIQLRNMLAGHSVNIMNRAVAVAELRVDPPEVLRMFGINVRSGPPRTDLRQMRRAAGAVFRELDGQWIVAREEVRDALQAGAAGLLSNPQLQMVAVPDSESNRRRRRIENYPQQPSVIDLSVDEILDDLDP